MTEAYIYDGIRTPFGRYAGSLARVRPDDLLASVIRQLVDKNKITPELIEDVIAGCTNQAGEDSRNIARNAALISGLPVTTGGMTLNRLCGSGLSAVLDAARTVRSGEANILIAGGVESMSRSPWVIGKAENGFSRNQKMCDSTLGWRFPNHKLTDQYGEDSNSETADNIAVDLEISREDSDAFAYWSQQKYQTALENGFFDDEIMCLEVPGASRKAPSVIVEKDEHPRPETTLAKLETLKSVSEGGVVTAGNASGLNDGAAALLIGSEEAGKKLGLRPRARVVCGAVVGVEPRVMGLGPMPATDAVMKRAGSGLD
ncbi:MAG: acetyl-CoA C-acyltransferase, partial [Gammaproteobacteria bacterium]|nr:acetyl-CoA C-acyltransferase [Gammaproteobacteria bacterium]